MSQKVLGFLEEASANYPWTNMAIRALKSTDQWWNKMMFEKTLWPLKVEKYYEVTQRLLNNPEYAHLSVEE